LETVGRLAALRLAVGATRETVMGLVKFIENVLFGLAFGIGFSIAANVLNFIGQFLHASH
jgi:flagellar biosynthesis protein FliR